MRGKHFFSATLFFLTSVAYAQLPAPSSVSKNGDCPADYVAAGGECAPGAGARFVIAKSGSCPDGYNADGNYCVAGSSARLAIRRAAMSCPSGYEPTGDYCLSTK